MISCIRLGSGPIYEDIDRNCSYLGHPPNSSTIHKEPLVACPDQQDISDIPSYYNVISAQPQHQLSGSARIVTKDSSAALTTNPNQSTTRVEQQPPTASSSSDTSYSESAFRPFHTMVNVRAVLRGARSGGGVHVPGATEPTSSIYYYSDTLRCGH